MTYDIGSSLGKQSQEFIQQQIEQNLGINVELNVLSGWEQYGAEVEDGSKWDISMNGWVPDYNDPMTYFGIWETGGSSNYEQYANPEYDQLLKDAQAETDSDKRLDMYSQLDQMLHDGLHLHAAVLHGRQVLHPALQSRVSRSARWATCGITPRSRSWRTKSFWKTKA